MIKKWACYTLITLAFSQALAGETAVAENGTDSPNSHLTSSADEGVLVRAQPKGSAITPATAPISSVTQANAATRLVKNAPVSKGRELSVDDVLTVSDWSSSVGDAIYPNAKVLEIDGSLDSPEIANPVFSLSGSSIPPVSNTIAREVPKTDSASSEGDSRGLSRLEVVDYRKAESAATNGSIHFDLSRAEDPGLGFGSIDMSSRLLPDERVTEASSPAFIGPSWGWISVVSVALFFTLTTVTTVFCISRAPVMEFEDSRRYKVEGARRTRLAHETVSRRYLARRRLKAPRKPQKKTRAGIADLDYTPKRST